MNITADQLVAALQHVQGKTPVRESFPMEERVSTLKRLRESDDPDSHLSEEVYKKATELDWQNPALSFRDVRTFAVRNYQRLREANPAQAFGQLLRAGIQTLANSWYQDTVVEWPTYIQEYPSSKRQEHHAPLHRSGFPKRVGPGVPYDEQSVVGEDVEIVNHKYMGGESFERELFDDDQSGQIRDRAGSLGSAMRVLEEAYVAGRIHGTAFTVGGDSYPASNVSTVNANGTTITTPFSVNLYATSVGNRPATYTQLSFPSLKTGFTALLNGVNPKGVKMMIRPDTLLVSSQDVVNVRTFLNSTWYPAVQGLGGETANSATSGVAGSNSANNPFKGMLNAASNLFLPSWAWYLVQSNRGPVFQRRDPMEIVQENPQAGASFQNDVYRFRSRSRWEFEWIDPRFWYEGNDGSVAGVQ